MKSKYANVKYDRCTGEIEGDTNMGIGNAMYKFSAGVKLLAVNLAMEVEPQSITQFMALADGRRSGTVSERLRLEWDSRLIGHVENLDGGNGDAHSRAVHQDPDGDRSTSPARGGFD